MVLATALGAALFCAAFLLGDRLRPLQVVVRDPRSLASFGAGLSTAYVFVHLMPELHSAREAFASTGSEALRYEGMAIYLVALAGFLAYYGLDHARKRLRVEGEAGSGRAFRLQMGGWAAYVVVAAYLLEHSLESTTAATAAYVVAITFHLVAADHSFRREHGSAYADRGRFVLAGAAIGGWLLGLLVALPLGVIAACVAFVSGAVIVNSAIMELPTEKDGRFAAFAAGSILYALILLPLG
ncbi:MAG TPA: hypothetical protein VF322_15410 [Gammaproteobacteria bacterium]